MGYWVLPPGRGQDLAGARAAAAGDIGSSAGSLVAGVVGSHRHGTGAILPPENVLFEAEREANVFSACFFGANPQIDVGDLERLVARMVPDMTFGEAYEKTGRQIKHYRGAGETHQRSRTER